MSEFFMGRDVSKGCADFVIIDQKRTIIESIFQVDDTSDDHAVIYNFMQRFFAGS